MKQWLDIAIRNVWRNRRRTLFLSGTVAIGAMALLLFVAYIAASCEGLRESIIRSGTGHIQIGKVGQFDGYEEQQLQFGLNPDEVQKIQLTLSEDKRVKRIVPRLYFGGLISNGQRTLTFQGTGTQPNRESQAFGTFQSVKLGQALSSDPDKTYSVLLGQEMARQLGVKPGDNVTIMTSTVFGSINAIDLDVSGIISTGNPQSDLYVLQIPLVAAQDLMRTKKISRLIVLLTETAETEPVYDDLNKRFVNFAEIRTWKQLVPIYEQVLNMYKNQFYVFGFIISIVIFLSVSTMTLTNIFERSREIGTMRAIGIPARQIRFVFTIEGLIQGSLGAIGGLLLAISFSWIVSEVGVTLPPPPGRNMGVPLRLLWVPEFALPILILLPGIAMVAAFFISRRISRLQIIHALSDNH